MLRPTVVAALLACVVLLPARGAAAPRSVCAFGSVAAFAGGRSTCLKPGARCSKALDGAYRAYGFRCRNARLARLPAAPPNDAPREPPSLPAPPPLTGRLVDVGGYRLMLECTGSGSPTIAIEAGRGTTRWGYRQIQYALGAETRVCSYDRPGADGGQSDPRPAGVRPTSATFARELRTVLANAGEQPPFLLVAGSFGGTLLDGFLVHYPDTVAGLVFVDSYSPFSAGASAITSGEAWEGKDDLPALQALDFGRRPVVVLETTMLGEGPQFVRYGSNMLVAQAPQYGHLVHAEAPGLVYLAVRLALESARTGRQLPTCAASPLAPLVRVCGP